VDPTRRFDSDAHRRVRAVLARGKADQDALAERLSAEERAARGELHDWTPKDQVAHNNFWREDAVRRLKAALEGGAPPDTSDDLAWNDRVFKEQRETPWEQLVTETERLYAESGTLISQISPDDVTEKDRFPWQGGESVGGYSARGGRPGQAIQALREALTVNPSLVESMRKDSDLDSLRTLPEFQALLAG
jgi:DinB family protein